MTELSVNNDVLDRSKCIEFGENYYNKISCVQYNYVVSKLRLLLFRVNNLVIHFATNLKVMKFVKSRVVEY